MVRYCVFVNIMFIIQTTYGFNFSPKPNLILKEPNLKTFKPKIKSSYFGYTINLRQTSVIIGAPRAQSTLESQRNIKETGAIYKCSLNGTCTPYVFDDSGNIKAIHNYFTLDSEIKDNQWLGASICGGTKDTDKLIVCAPRLIAEFQDDYYMHGVCYYTPDTLSDRPHFIKKITPLRVRRYQTKERGGRRSADHMYGEQGISCHVANNNGPILIGAPGIDSWKGSVIRYNMKPDNVVFDVRRPRSAPHIAEVFIAEVPNPDTWRQPYNSYFGYAVTSGNFDDTRPSRIFYVATAPRTNKLSGEAYIFDIATSSNGVVLIKKFYTFSGSQFGEYYGYAILDEDLNGDGLPDLIISAPQFRSDPSVDRGAVYVYINKGRFVFEPQKTIISPVNDNGRFGSSIAKLGDINNDGYNDIAIGAPFAGNGCVFIYFGSENGLSEQPKQRLVPIEIPTLWGPQMFGYSLSTGFDIDNNGFNDFAIGAPNAEAVYVYRAYPIVKIIATINSLRRQIKPDQTEFQINICCMITTTSSKVQSQDVAIRIYIDPLVKRVTLKQSNSSELVFNATAMIYDQCRLLDATLAFKEADIFKPIDLEMHYDLIHGVPNSEEFCDKCAAVDPAEPKAMFDKITFATGCKSDICVADLKVTSSWLSKTYNVGTSRTITVTYNISNSGETAYLPQINITSSNRMPFNKVPSSCNEHGYVLLCVLNRGQSMGFNTTDSITIDYDVTQIEGRSMTLMAAVFSTSKEHSQDDNAIYNTINLKWFTEIQAIGKQQTPHINLEKVLNTTEIINNYQIKSDGPSRIQNLEITFEIPLAYKFANVTIPFVDINKISIQGAYDDQNLAVELYQIDGLSLMPIGKFGEQVENQFIPPPPRINPIDIENNSDKLPQSELLRKRREINLAVSESELKKAGKKNDRLGEELMGFLPINRTIVFVCNDPETTICARAVLRVYNFLPDMTATVTVKYDVNLEEVNNFLIEPREFFAIITKLDIVKVGDVYGKSIHITRKIEYNVISKHQLHKTPIWVYILATLGGLLLLALIVYGMHKVGFFQRKKKEELDRLIQANLKVKKLIEERKLRAGCTKDG